MSIHDPEHDAKLRRSEDLRETALKSIENARQYQSANDSGRAQMEVTRAWKYLEEALNICPLNHRARFLLVSCAMNANDFNRAKDEALKIYRALSSDAMKRMNDSVLHLSIAHACKMSGDLESAVRFAREATQLYPTDPQPQMILGEVRQQQGRSEEAEQRCLRALKLHQSPECMYRLTEQNVYFLLCILGAAQIDIGKVAEAEPHLLRAVDLAGNTSTLALRHLINVYRLLSRTQDALRMAQRAVQVDPTDEEARRDLAELQSLVSAPVAPMSSTRWRHSGIASQRTSQRSAHLRPPAGGYAAGSDTLVAPGRNDENKYDTITLASARSTKRDGDSRTCDRQCEPLQKDWFSNFCCIDRSERDA
eukprot:gnl/MRDRNA2_/MRDRNA2_35333_c0_seq1.p1 gnl/MRDRNA2_/MRDRNA2_35333_c0~~gnl/MRDRNA2_/MRDRNA2_35333_c0_seq1.p1  ORF type:complete len:365 (-),score=57.14 gnl/MRDRNA2_/MRDRNA2_35333_c0_seq1:10-1104(-)